MEFVFLQLLYFYDQNNSIPRNFQQIAFVFES